MQEESSSGESTFEFVDKKSEAVSGGVQSEGGGEEAGSLLSKVSPPSALPSFVPVPQASTSQTFHQTKFSPVIPASKGTAANSSAAGPSTTPTEATENINQGGLFGWVKDAAAGSTSILTKVAEKAKSSVDSMMITLDPQIKDFLDKQLELYRTNNTTSNKTIGPIIFQHIPWFEDDPLNNTPNYFTVPYDTRMTMLEKLVNSGVKYVFCGHLHRNAGGTYKNLNVVVTSAIGGQLGEDESGVRIVKVKSNVSSNTDLEIVVASDKEVKISPIREAFQSVFGRVNVRGLGAEAKRVAAQPVGYEAALQAAWERIDAVRSLQPSGPIIAVENFVVQITTDKWYDLGALVLSDVERGLVLETFTQMTPVPSLITTLAQDETPAEYPLSSTGFAITIGSLMASNLHVHPSEWHEALTGVSRRDMLLLSAKSLANIYKNSIQ